MTVCAEETKKKLTVLVIDDDPGDVNMLQRYLQGIPGREIEVLCFTDSEAGRAELARGEADVIFLDYLLGKTTGLELLKSIRQSGDDRPIVVLTGYGDERIAAEIIREGADDYLPKAQISSESLARAISNARRNYKRRQDAQDHLREVERLAITDPLTGLYNHYYFDDCIRQELSRARRYTCPLSCLMLDIDHFKRVNDTFGHLFGSMVIQEAARLIKEVLRDVDVIARYGGDEFAVILPHTDGAGAFTVAEKIRKRIEAKVFTDGVKVVSVTISIGESTYPDNHAVTSQELIHMADQALYKAKTLGRNAVVAFNETKVQKNGTANIALRDQERLRNLGKGVEKLGSQKGFYVDSILSLAKALEIHDGYTFRHSANVGRYSERIARRMKLPKKEIDTIKNAALLHDIGKLGIKEDILLKRGPLSEEEFEVVMQHPCWGVDIVSPLKVLDQEIPLIRHHHERNNGSGYPSGLKRNQIPLGSKVIAVADVFDAMTSDRPYRKAMSIEQAVKVIGSESGVMLDRRACSALLEEKSAAGRR